MIQSAYPHNVAVADVPEQFSIRAGEKIGLVPIVWCAAAWTLCLREHLLAERLRGCVALSLMAGVSAILMVSSMGLAWRFDGKRRWISRRVGLLAKTYNARRIAALRVESTRPSAVADGPLPITLV